VKNFVDNNLTGNKVFRYNLFNSTLSNNFIVEFYSKLAGEYNNVFEKIFNKQLGNVFNKIIFSKIISKLSDNIITTSNITSNNNIHHANSINSGIDIFAGNILKRIKSKLIYITSDELPEEISLNNILHDKKLNENVSLVKNTRQNYPDVSIIYIDKDEYAVRDETVQNNISSANLSAEPGVKSSPVAWQSRAIIEKLEKISSLIQKDTSHKQPVSKTIMQPQSGNAESYGLAPVTQIKPEYTDSATYRTVMYKKADVTDRAYSNDNTDNTEPAIIDLVKLSVLNRSGKIINIREYFKRYLNMPFFNRHTRFEGKGFHPISVFAANFNKPEINRIKYWKGMNVPEAGISGLEYSADMAFNNIIGLNVIIRNTLNSLKPLQLQYDFELSSYVSPYSDLAEYYNYGKHYNMIKYGSKDNYNNFYRTLSKHIDNAVNNIHAIYNKITKHINIDGYKNADRQNIIDKYNIINRYNTINEYKNIDNFVSDKIFRYNLFSSILNNKFNKEFNKEFYKELNNEFNTKFIKVFDSEFNAFYDTQVNNAFINKYSNGYNRRFNYIFNKVFNNVFNVALYNTLSKLFKNSSTNVLPKKSDNMSAISDIGFGSKILEKIKSSQLYNISDSLYEKSLLNNVLPDISSAENIDFVTNFNPNITDVSIIYADSSNAAEADMPLAKISETGERKAEALIRNGKFKGNLYKLEKRINTLLNFLVQQKGGSKQPDFLSKIINQNINYHESGMPVAANKSERNAGKKDLSYFIFNKNNRTAIVAAAGKGLVEKLIHNVERTFKENRFEGNLAMPLVKGKIKGISDIYNLNNIYNAAENNVYNMAETEANFGSQQNNQNNLVNNYLNYKIQLTNLENIFLSNNNSDMLRDEKSNIISFPRNYNLNKPDTAKGSDFTPVIDLPVGRKEKEILKESLTYIITEKRIEKAYKNIHLNMLKRFKELKKHKDEMAVTNNLSHKAIVKRSEVNKMELERLQNNNHLVLSNNTTIRSRDIGTTEMIILAPPVIQQDFNSAYYRSMQPITYKTEDMDSKGQQQQKPVMKSLNTSVEMPRKTINQTISDIDLMDTTELNKLVDKIYSQLETRLARERRRFGF